MMDACIRQKESVTCGTVERFSEFAGHKNILTQLSSATGLGNMGYLALLKREILLYFVIVIVGWFYEYLCNRSTFLSDIWAPCVTAIVYLFFISEEQEMLWSWHKYALLPQVPILSIMSENGRHKISQWQRLWLCFFDFYQTRREMNRVSEWSVA